MDPWKSASKRAKQPRKKASRLIPKPFTFIHLFMHAYDPLVIFDYSWCSL